MLRERLFQRAALKEQFDPRALLHEVLTEEQSADVLMRGQLMSALREACISLDETGYAGGKGWLMRPIPRRKALTGLDPASDVPEGPISDAFRGLGVYSETSVREMLVTPPAQEDLAEIVQVIERAGPQAPAYNHLMALVGTLNRMRKDKLSDDILGKGMVGRQNEITLIRDALEKPQFSAPLKTIHIEGMPGIGKTYLLEEVYRICRSRPEIVVVRLDFDRSSLRAGPGSGGTGSEAVFDEVSRQIAEALPAEAKSLQKHRLEFAERQTEIGKTSSEGRIPYDMLQHMVTVLTEHDRQLLFQLDTLEVLHGFGATFVDQLMGNLDRFAQSGKVGVTIISAGRGPIFRTGHHRLLHHIPLERLDDEIAEAILSEKGVPEHLWPRITELSRGNPLRLILVTRAIETNAEEDIADDEIRGVDNAFLYRAVLSRVPADIREVAAEGLILTQLDEMALRKIVGPALDIAIDADLARQMMDLLRQQDWLVEPHPSGGFRHRKKVRSEVLEVIYQEREAQAAAINRMAADVLAESDPSTALYHRLQLTRVGEPIPVITSSLAASLPDAQLEELPHTARDAVLQAAGKRSRAFLEDEDAVQAERHIYLRRGKVREGGLWLVADPEAKSGKLRLVEPDPSAPIIGELELRDLRVLLEGGERQEASHLLASRFTTPFSPDSEAGQLALAHQWRTGQWSMAQLVFDLMDESTRQVAFADDPALSGRVLLEIWAETHFDVITRRLRDDDTFRMQAAEILQQTGRIGLQGGALDFAFLVAGAPDMLTDGAAVGAIAQYMPGVFEEASIELQHRAEAVREELGLSFVLGQRGASAIAPADAAVSVAPMNPYAEPILALIEQLEVEGRSKLLDDVLAFRNRLPEVARQLVPSVDGFATALDRIGQRPSDVLAVVKAAGLIADWARGITFFSPVPELPTLAEAAERWQQTTAGLWRYGGQPPEDWTSDRRADWLVEDRARRMLDDKDPEELALRMLRIWQAPFEDNASPPPAMLAKRMAGPYEAVTGEMSLEDRLGTLQQAGLASVQQAPAAVLAACGMPAQQIFGRT